MRQIDADALLEELEKMRFPGAPYVDAGVEIAIGKVCEAPSIETERSDHSEVSDSISRQAAIDAFCEMSCGSKWCGISCIEVQTIEHVPSAQPQITHCAECIHWKHSAVRESYCEVFDWMSKAEDFCSFAEKKEEGGE